MSNSSSPLPRTVAVLERGIVDGLHTGAQLYVSHHGKVVADLAVGENRPGVPMTTEAIQLWLSAGKPIAAVAIAQLWERGLLDLDDRVEKFIPEFGAHGKAAVTIRHILTHTGGFRVGEYPARASEEEIIARLCALPLEHGWIVGRKAAYHPSSSWYILGEIIRRIDRRDYAAYVHEEIVAPLGLKDVFASMPIETYRAFGDRMGLLMNREGPRPPAPDSRESEEAAAAFRPGSNMRGPIRELGRIYEMLLAGGRIPGSDERILSTPAVEAISGPHRIGLKDETLGDIVDWGLGFLVNSRPRVEGELPPPYGFGVHASPRAFGHGGAQSSAGFADPECGLAVALACNGMPGERKHQARIREIFAALYEELGLGRP